MTHFPRKDRDARTGSGLRGQPLVAHRDAELKRQARPHQRAAKAYRQQIRKLFTKADLRRAAAIGHDVNREWREATLKAGADAPRADALKLVARRKLERRLTRELPNYRQWKLLQRAHLREQGRLAAETLAAVGASPARIEWGDRVAVELEPGAFVAPFTTFDVQMIDWGDFVVADESFAKPAIGHMVNNYSYDQDQSVSIGAGLLGILPIENAASLVSCGVAFTTPSAGRLKIGASLQNIYNNVVVKVTDKFGFSSAQVWVAPALFVAVVRGTVVERISQPLPGVKVESDGDDVNYGFCDLDTTQPYGITVETNTRLAANESVLVLAGSEMLIGTVLDDMHVKAKAVLWWQLKALSIEMAVDVIT